MARFLLGALPLLLVVASSCKKAAIKGEVLDGFGKPVDNALVQIDGTQFEAHTNGSGKYSVGYVPGSSISVSITKPGYTGTSFKASIATESTYPAASVTIFKIPSDSAISVIAGGKYVPLTQLPMQDRGVSSVGNFGMSTSILLYYFDVDSLKILTVRKGATPFVFADNDAADQKILRLWPEIEMGGIRAEHVAFVRFANNGSLGMMMGDYSDRVQIINEDFTVFATGFAVRRPSLDVGEYAFVRYSKGTAPSVGARAYLIRVVP